MSSPDFQTRPLDEWFANTLAGDIALCDPFSGQPLCGEHIGNAPDSPTTAFMGDYTLGNGYGMWKASKGLGMTTVGVYLADPSRLEGLGDRRELEEVVSNFDVMGFASTRSVRLGERLRRTVSGLGAVTAGGDIAPDDDYEGVLLEAAVKSDTLAFGIDPSKDFFGEPDSADSRGLQAVRDAVVAQGYISREALEA